MGKPTFNGRSMIAPHRFVQASVNARTQQILGEAALAKMNRRSGKPNPEKVAERRQMLAEAGIVVGSELSLPPRGTTHVVTGITSEGLVRVEGSEFPLSPASAIRWRKGV